MTPLETIMEARARLKSKYGSDVESRLLDAAEENRTTDSYSRYLTPPPRLVAYEQRIILDPDNPPNFAPGAAWTFARYWTPKKGSIYAYGPEGVGKSSVCRFILAGWCAAGWPIMDLPASRLELDLWKNEHYTAFKMAKRCRILLVDDLTNARMSARGWDIFRQIIDARHESGKATLITSQTSYQVLHAKISETMGDEVYATSLLRRFNPFVEIEFRGESYRVGMKPEA